METIHGTRAAWAVIVLLALMAVDARQVQACDDMRNLETEVLGMSRGQVVFFVSELWEDTRCGGGRWSSAQFEVRFASFAGVWTHRHIPISSFKSSIAHLPKGLQGAARRKAVAFARKLPSFIAVKVRQSIGCQHAGTFHNQNPKISICGRVLRYDDSGAKPEIVSSIAGTPKRWYPRIAPGTPAFEAIRSWWPPNVPGHDTYIVGRKWHLRRVERFGIGPKTVYVMDVLVPSLEGGTPEWGFSILLPAAVGASAGASTRGRGIAPPARP